MRARPCPTASLLTDRHRAHGAAAAPGLTPPTVSPPYHVRRPISLIPLPLWPIDEAKLLSSSFPCSLVSPTPLLCLALPMPTNHLDNCHRSHPVFSYFDARVVPWR
jgi:hypothetical protein